MTTIDPQVARRRRVVRDAAMSNVAGMVDAPDVVVACGTTGAASHGAAADRNRPAAVTGHDADHDGLSDSVEIRRYHTDPRKHDTDRDGLSDGAEVRRYKTNPRKPTRTATVRRPSRASCGHKPSPDPRSRPGFPGEDNTGVPAPDGAVGVHRAFDDLEAQHA